MEGSIENIPRSVEENDFTSVLKHVQRTRRKKHEEKEWKNYLESKVKKEREQQVSQVQIRKKTIKICIIKPEECGSSEIYSPSSNYPIPHEFPAWGYCLQDNIPSNCEEPSLMINKTHLGTRLPKQQYSSEEMKAEKKSHNSYALDINPCTSDHFEEDETHEHFQNTSKLVGGIINRHSELQRNNRSKDSHSNVYGSLSCTKDNLEEHNTFHLHQSISNNVEATMKGSSTKQINERPKFHNKLQEESHISQGLYPSIHFPWLVSCRDVQRIQNLRTRIVIILKQLLNFVNCEVDRSDAEFERLRKRCSEFISRFTRNYVYQIKRQIEDVKKKSLNISKSTCGYFISTVISSFQISLQALQLLEKNLAVCLIDGVPNQVSDFLSYLLDLSVTTKKIIDIEKGKNETEELCKLVMRHLAKCTKVVNYDVPTTKKVTKKANKLPVNDNKLENLWIYAPETKTHWKNRSAALAKVKFGPPKVKNMRLNEATEDVKNTLQPSVKLQKGGTAVLNKCSEQKPKEKAGKWRNTARCMTEDQVRTMMEIIRPDTPIDKIGESGLPPPTQELNKEKLLIKSISEMAISFNTAIVGLQELLSSVRNITQFEGTKNRKGVDASLEVKQSEKNVKLLIMKEEENVQKINKKPYRKDKPMQLSDRDRYIALDYSHYFDEYKKKSFYYKCQNKDKPWDIVSRISDAIVDKITHEVGLELESETLVNKILELEFKE